MTSRFWACDFQILKGGSHDFLIQKVSASTVTFHFHFRDHRRENEKFYQCETKLLTRLFSLQDLITVEISSNQNMFTLS